MAGGVWDAPGESKARKQFFSEEKNQKTFIPAPAARSRPNPGSIRKVRNKSLLVLLFRKEHF
jgi:hypothetical protein